MAKFEVVDGTKEEDDPGMKKALGLFTIGLGISAALGSVGITLIVLCLIARTLGVIG